MSTPIYNVPLTPGNLKLLADMMELLVQKKDIIYLETNQQTYEDLWLELVGVFETPKP